MSNIVFFTDKITPNYLEAPFFYKYRKGIFSFNGKYIHSNYLYWILKNNNIDNVKLVDNISEIKPEDILFFHYDFKDVIPNKTDYVKVQIVSDRPKVGWADYYCINDPSRIKDEFLLFEPLPVGMEEKTPSFPPSKFHTNCAEFYLPEEFKDKKELEKLKRQGIYITFEHDKHVTPENFDVFFFIRSTRNLDDRDKRGLKKHIIDQDSYKNACRLFQSFHMHTPAIFSYHTSMEYERKSEFDFLEANDFYEFLSAANFLRIDKKYYNLMIENCKIRKQEFSNSLIVSQILDIKNKIINQRNQKN